MSSHLVISIPTRRFAARRTFSTSALLRVDPSKVDPTGGRRNAAGRFEPRHPPFFFAIFLAILLGQYVAEPGSGKAEETKKDKQT
jgi:hypothetical protein